MYPLPALHEYNFVIHAVWIFRYFLSFRDTMSSNCESLESNKQALLPDVHDTVAPIKHKDDNVSNPINSDIVLNTPPSNEKTNSSVDDSHVEPYLDYLKGTRYCLSNLTPNDFESKDNVGDTDEVVCIADKTITDQMFCVFTEWISFVKGYVYILKIRDLKVKLTENDEQHFYKILVTQRTKVGTPSIIIPMEKTKKRLKKLEVAPPTTARCRGGRGRGNSAGNMKRPSTSQSSSQRELILTWSRYALKAVLKAYRMYI